MIARANLWSLGLGGATAFIAALAASCIESDPDHCSNKLGDASCGGATMYCDRCESSDNNLGCVANVPTSACSSPVVMPNGTTTTGDTGTSSGGSTAGESTATTTTSSPTECTEDGDRDPVCPGPTPFCVAGACASCADAGEAATTSGDDFCESLGGPNAMCGEFGDCVQCTAVAAARACAQPTPFCDPEGTCSGCFEHAQCGDAGCDLSTGTCLDAADLYFVQTPLCAPETGGGTNNDPWCNLDSVQPLLDGGAQITVRFNPGVYTQSLAAFGAAVLVALGEDGVVLPNLTAATGGRIFTDNVALSSSAGNTVTCSGAGAVWLRDTSVIDGVGIGIDAGLGCNITLERSVVSGNLGGILANGADVTLLSSAVINNSSGVDLLGGRLDANHATVVQNPAFGGGSNFMCMDDPALTIRNSVVMRSEAASFSGCDGALSLSNSVVDDPSLEDEANGVRYIEFAPSLFVDAFSADPHVSAAPSIFEDVAVREAGPPYVDIDGDAFALAVGANNWAGCDQP